MTEVADRPEFSVYWWDPMGNYYCERSYIHAKDAVELAHSLTTRPAAKMGAIQKVMITDGGDCCCFQWEHGKGITFK